MKYFEQIDSALKLIETETSQVKFPDQRVSHRRKVNPLARLFMINSLHLSYINEELKQLFTPIPCSLSEVLGR